MASASNVKEKAGDAVDKARDAASDAAGTAKEKARNAASYAEDKTNQGMQAVGDYLSQHDIKDMAKDLSELVKKHPLVAVGVGVGVGLLIASMTRR